MFNREGFELTSIPMIDAETGKELKAVYHDGGLTVPEKFIMGHLLDAWAALNTIDISETSKQEFADGLHKCQSVLGQQVLSRLFPDYWNK